MSDKEQRLSKRTETVKKRETLDEKLRKSQEESAIRKEKTLARNRKVELSNTAQDSDDSLSSSSSSNPDKQEEPTLN